ncbi:hypothetical protein [Adhaeribacter aquaticus]|uniref:hypothetical protein n=1 Tax=Adhaeribacter aquaticus TaxID=299567 RepID=UPI0004240E36|nr:hypothetical protein [Adhaeribacter aquaticus]
MIYTNINIVLYKKEDTDSIVEILKSIGIQAPVFLFEFEEIIQIRFTNEYEHFEINSEIIKNLPDYEFTKEIGKGRKSIRIEISRIQSPFSRDGWGRPLEELINETIYLVKKTKIKSLDKSEVKFNPKIKVLFEEEEREYYINIVPGIDRKNDERGYLLLNCFTQTDPAKSETDLLVNKLFESPSDAFSSGVVQLEQIVEREFEEYQSSRKRRRKKK